MRRFYIPILFALLVAWPASAQHGPVNPAEHEIMEVIETMFDGMRALDADMVASTFAEGAVLNSSGSRNGTPIVQSTPMAGFVNAIRQSAGGPAWDERIWNVQIEVQDNLATAWMDYAFFAGDRFSHCGSNTFQLARQADGHWRTIALADTRVMSGCEPDPADLEESLVRVALRHYLRGHATGQASEHQQAFHEVANLHFMRDGALQTVTSAEYIGRASGQPAADEAERRRWIDWVDISGDAAVGKITLDYPGATLTDYMQLLKVDGQWKIVNKIFSVENEE
ncbi:MAG: nuclear transport factor 2 family protein [Bacteroidetes bacterium]|nr:nuclear transport factor 2 family protein [Bacteroidota bacterium]MDA0873512.1 nuclear transport factor 2 family protein [Bacteroidota bacterium]